MATSKQELENLNSLLKNVSKNLKSIGKNAEKAFKEIGDPSTLKEIQKTEKGLDEMEKATKELTKTQIEQAKLQKRLTASKTKEAQETAKLKLAIQEQNKANKQTAKSKLGLISIYEKESIKLNNLRKRYKEVALAEGTSSRSAKRLGKEVSKLDKKLKKVDASAGQFQRNVGNYPKLMGGITAGFAAAGLGLAAFTRVLGSSVNIAKEFEQSNANLASVLGVSRTEIGALTEDAKRLGAATSFSASEVSGLQTEFAKLGFNQQEILDATESTLNLAAATGSDLATAASVAGATLGAFGLSADETGRVTDVMAKSFSISALDMEKFSEAMKNAAPSAKLVGQSVEQTTAQLATLSKAGITGSKAGSQLNTGFIKLAAQGKTVKDVYAAMAGKEGLERVNAAVELVGIGSAKTFAVLAAGEDQTKDFTKQLQNAGGAAEKMALEQLDTLEGSLKILNSAWEGFVLSLLDGEGAFSSLSRGIVEGTTALLGFFTAQEDLAEVSFETAKALQKEANESEKLLNEYESLVKDGVEPTKKEKEKLEIITLKLKKRLGESVIAINKETGAFELNTEAVRAQIKLKRFASDEEAAQFASRLVGTQEAIKLAKSELKEQEKIIKLTSKQLEIAKEVENERIRTRKNGESGLFKLSKEAKETASIRNEAINEKRKINIELTAQQELEADLIEKLTALNYSAADAQKLINGEKSEAVDISENGGKAAEDLDDKTRKLTGAIEKQQKVVSDLQTEIKQGNENELPELGFQLRVAQTELERLQELAKEGISISTDGVDVDAEIKKVNDKKLKASKELAKDLADFEKELANGFVDPEDKKLEQDHEDLKTRLAKEKELFKAGTDYITDQLAKRSKAKIDALNEEERGLEDQQSKLEDLAIAGNENAVKSLAIAEKRKAEIRREEEEEIKKAQRNAIILAGIKAYGETGDVGKTLTDTALLLAGLETLSLPSAYDGVDDTGGRGNVDSKGGKLWNLHPNEQVFSKEDRKQVGFKSRKEIIEIVKLHDSGALKIPNMKIESQNNNFQSVSDLKELKETLLNGFNTLNRTNKKNRPFGSDNSDMIKAIKELKTNSKIKHSIHG